MPDPKPIPIDRSLDLLDREYREGLAKVSCLEDLDIIETKYFGRKSRLTQISRSVGKLHKDDRPLAGRIVAQARENMELQFLERKLFLLDPEAVIAIKKHKIVLYDTVLLRKGEKHKSVSFFQKARGIKFENGVEKTYDHTNLDGPNIVNGIRHVVVRGIVLQFNKQIVDFKEILNGKGLFMLDPNGFDCKKYYKYKMDRKNTIHYLSIQELLKIYITDTPIKLDVFDMFQFDLEWENEIEPFMDIEARLEFFGTEHMTKFDEM